MSRRVRAQLVEPRLNGAWTCLVGVVAVTPADRSGRCGFLRGTIGVRTSCRIYETRPDICRTFKPGSASCLVARRTGLPRD